MNELPIIARACSHANAVAFRHGSDTVTYQQLAERSANVAMGLLQGCLDLNQERIAMLVPPGAAYTAIQWGIWRAGGIALPLCLTATGSELEYALSDADVSTVMVTRTKVGSMKPLCERLGLRLVVFEQIETKSVMPLPEVDPNRNAMILYTSGTTSKPKGVVHTHANIKAQIESLVEAWRWEPSDSIPLFLPLHHIHGIMNVMSCALWSGATIEAFARFDLPTIFDRVAAPAYTVFMAVPTIYVKMIEAMKGMPEIDRNRIVDGFKSMRLMVSGSAALPANVHEQWTALTGQKLLERYGMTEIGMALSNPYKGERRPGAVGKPLPGVDVRLKAEDGSLIEKEGLPGEIQVKGPGVFKEYWNRPEITAASFEDGWFKTGDMAVLEDGYYRILGRSSVDIIKSGGYKLSALEIEACLLDHPAIRECAVVGIPDATWGEAVAVAAVLNGDATLGIEDLRAWCRERMSGYKIPRTLLVVDELPRNAMGKVTKPAVADLFRD